MKENGSRDLPAWKNDVLEIALYTWSMYNWLHSRNAFKCLVLSHFELLQFEFDKLYSSYFDWKWFGVLEQQVHDRMCAHCDVCVYHTRPLRFVKLSQHHLLRSYCSQMWELLTQTRYWTKVLRKVCANWVCPHGTTLSPGRRSACDATPSKHARRGSPCLREHHHPMGISNPSHSPPYFCITSWIFSYPGLSMTQKQRHRSAVIDLFAGGLFISASWRTNTSRKNAVLKVKLGKCFRLLQLQNRWCYQQMLLSKNGQITVQIVLRWTNTNLK